MSPLTFGQGNHPMWTPDGTRILFSSNRSGALQVYSIPADGSGAAEPFAGSPTPHAIPASMSPDGNVLLTLSGTLSNMDIWTLRTDGEARPFIESPVVEQFPVFSPDGRWVAYRSDISGYGVIYVTPFPGPGPRFPISSGSIGTGSSMSPAWSRDGREMFFWTHTSPDTVAFQVVSVDAARGFSNVRPKTLFEMEFEQTRPLRSYDPSPDGQRILMVQWVTREVSAEATIHLVQNWFNEVEQLAP